MKNLFPLDRASGVLRPGQNHLGGIRNVRVWGFSFSWVLFLLMLSILVTPLPSWAIHLHEQLDEWNFLRSHFDARGITLETVNTTDIGSNINQKGKTQALVIGDIDLLLTLDTEKLVDWQGGTVFLYGLGLYGGNISSGVDAQGASNISAENIWKLTSPPKIFGNSLKPGINKICFRSVFQS
jgi:hypothetical protein